MCISFTSRQCMSVGIIEQREMDVITLVLHLIVFILAPKVCVTKITDANIRCKTFEENGEKTLGFVTRLPHGKTPCYELDGYFNCNGLAGEDRDYCVKTCCKDAKRYTGLKIKCIVFTNGSSERSEGFFRKMPPYINVKCYENGGIFNCEALKEPEISHCKSTCCRGSYNGTMKDVNEVWEFKSVEIEDRKDSEALLRKELELWKTSTYAFEVLAALLFVIAIVVSVLFWRYHRKVRQHQPTHIFTTTDSHDENPSIVTAAPRSLSDADKLSPNITPCNVPLMDSMV